MTGSERVPIIPTFSAGLTEKLTFLSPDGSLLEYEKETQSKTIVPFAGQSVGGFLSIMKKSITRQRTLHTNLNSQSEVI
jgi:hypothetical protein